MLVEKKPDYPMPHVPRDFTKAPFFAATKQISGRTIEVGDRKYIIGGFHPTDRRRTPPALDIRHGRVCFTLLSFRRLPFSEQLIRFSLNEFCKRFARTNAGHFYRNIKDLLTDLIDCWIKIWYPGDPHPHSFRLIERAHFVHKEIRRQRAKANDPQEELWLEEIILSKEFNDLFNDLSELTQIRIDVLNAMTSPLAQAIYTFLPSRAYHHTQRSPFQITLTNLLNQVSMRVPAKKSLRKQLFTQNQHPVITQLDHKQTLNGTLNVALDETADGSDFKLLAWIDKAEYPLPELKDNRMLQAWRKSGRSEEQFRIRYTATPELSSYELDLLEVGKIQLDTNERFFQKAKALLGEGRFVALLSEAKGDALEGREPTKNPTARLIYRILEALEVCH